MGKLSSCWRVINNIAPDRRMYRPIRKYNYLQADARCVQAEDGEGEDVLEGIRRATSILQHDALLQTHGHLLEDPSSLRPDTLESLTNAQDVSPPPPTHTHTGPCTLVLARFGDYGVEFVQGWWC